MRLQLHPQSQAGAVERIDVEVQRAPGGLSLRYVLRGDVASVRLPAGAAGRADELWMHTCFEAFAGHPEGPYFEFNFSPAQAWSAYRFDFCRAGMRNADVAAPYIVVAKGDGQFALTAEIALPGLAAAPRLGLSAVIEDLAGEKSYWALAHPPGKPDFHHADCFALPLPPA